jgi:hypothetical protein
MSEEWEDILNNMQDKDSDYKEFEIWLENGIERGWVTEPFCNTHEGDPYMTEEEQQEWEERRPLPSSNKNQRKLTRRKNEKNRSGYYCST